MSNANVHGFGDPDNNNNGRRGDEERGQQADIFAGFMGQRQDKNPREETFWEMLSFTFCPTFSKESFTFLISVVNIGIFGMNLLVDGVNVKGSLLEVKTGYMMGSLAEIPSKVKSQFQIWRLFTPMFLHHDFSHISMNTFSLIIWGSMIESMLGTKIFTKIYFASGIGGCLMSVAFHSYDIISVGASGAIFGTTGALIGILTLNWKALESSRYANMRHTLVCVVIMVVIFNGLLVISSKNTQGGPEKVDNYAHGGGFIVGTFLSMFIGNCLLADGSYEKTVRKVGLFTLGAFCVLVFVFLFV